MSQANILGDMASVRALTSQSYCSSHSLYDFAQDVRTLAFNIRASLFDSYWDFGLISDLYLTVEAAQNFLSVGIYQSQDTDFRPNPEFISSLHMDLASAIKILARMLVRNRLQWIPRMNVRFSGYIRSFSRRDNLFLAKNRLHKQLQLSIRLREPLPDNPPDNPPEPLCNRLRRLLLIYLCLYALLFTLHLFGLTAEFPNNFRHPCTTMPWTIWPALVVLWGVCWMFYPEKSAGTGYGSLLDVLVHEDPFLFAGQDDVFDFDWYPRNDVEDPETSTLDLCSITLDGVGCGNRDENFASSSGSMTEPPLELATENGVSKCLVDVANVSTAPPTSRLEIVPSMEYHPARLATIMPATSSTILPGTVSSGMITHLPPMLSVTGRPNGQNMGYSDNLEAVDNDRGKQLPVPVSMISNNRADMDPAKDYGHKCPICLKSVGRKEDLERHHKSLHEEGKHYCTYPGCTRTKPFARTDNLKEHVRKCHLKNQGHRTGSQNTTVQIPNGGHNNIMPTPQTLQVQKRRRDESYPDEEVYVEDMHAKCRRLEDQVAHLQRENERLKNVNEALSGLIQSQMRQLK